jgi:importin-7
VDNEDLVFALEAIVDKFGERIAPYAITMAQQLSIAFWKYANANEEDEDDEEMASMAAYGEIREEASLGSK